jgi:hypothetical protein
MFAELRKIKNNLIKIESFQKVQTIFMTTITMIKFLSNNLKFLMSISSKDFILKTLSSKMLQRSEILIRFINEVACEMLTNFAISKFDKENILRKKSKDLTYLIFMTNEKVHIYEKIEKLTNKSNICWKKEFEISAKRNATTKNIHDQHCKNKVIALNVFRFLVRKWIIQKRKWKYAIALNLYLNQKFIIIWFQQMIERNLLEYHIFIQKNIVEKILIANVLIDLNLLKKIESELKILSTIDESMTTISAIDESMTMISTIDESMTTISAIDESMTMISTIDESMTITYKSSNALKTRISKKSRQFNMSTLSKKRKSDFEKNEKFLHSDLQVLIIFKFHSVNLFNEDD